MNFQFFNSRVSKTKPVLIEWYENKLKLTNTLQDLLIIDLKINKRNMTVPSNFKEKEKLSEKERQSIAKRENARNKVKSKTQD